MNNLTIIGNLTRDPESRTVGENTVCNFTVAVNRSRKDKDGNDQADFFRVGAWGKLGENCQKYLAKGRKVAVRGSVSCRGYAGNDGTPQASMDVFAETVEFLTPKGESNATGNMTDVSGQVGDDLPF